MIVAVLIVVSLTVRASEEKIRGVLEKTTKPGACAQIADALADVYYVAKTEEAEKAVAKYVGKNERVVVSGTVEQKEGDPAFFLNLKAVEPYAAKLPPAPPPPEPKAEPKTEAKTPEAKTEPAKTEAKTEPAKKDEPATPEKK
jgi:hypothetical protein